ncbi:MAG: heme-binding protein [Planctomycetota bacterium]|nr:heme-binding protein [Planctomycetota bacterium]
MKYQHVAACAVVAAASIFARGVAAPQPGAQGAPAHATSAASKPVLTLDGAQRVLAAAVAEARAKHAGGAIAVVDDGGHLIVFQRLDATFPAGAEVSIGKARTAATFRKPTKAFEDALNAGRFALAGVQQMTPLQGGIPIVIDGHVVGGIGVSGAHSQAEDEQIAIAGAAAASTAP